MKSRILNILKIAVPLALAAGLMVYLFRQVSFKELAGTFQTADWTLVAISWVLGLVSHWSRGYRWKLLLQPLGQDPKTKNAFMAVLAGYFANFALPRLGEMIRCTVLKTTDEVPLNAGLGTVVAERVFDVLMLGVFTLFTLVLEFDRINAWLANLFGTKISGTFESLKNNYLFLITLVVLMMVIGFLLWYFRKKIMANAFVQKIQVFIAGLWEGIISIRKLEKKGEFIFHTLLIWALYYSTTYIILLALPQTASLDWRAGFAVFLAGTFGMAAPVQGGLGAFHLAVINMLLTYSIAEKDGISLAFFMHTSQTVLLLISGGISMLIYAVLWARRKKVKA
ncbi:MAG: flippase-like domain-containing protein [Verrucomicrobia bacterium]|nr:flippase-like domain-containing protein [Cytophagales bacterium]